MLRSRLLSFFLSVVLFFSAGPFIGGRTAQQANRIAKNEFAAAGYALTSRILTKSYDPVLHRFKEYMGKGGMPYVWSAASMIETLADANRLFPASVRVRSAYRDALTRVIGKYLVRDAAIRTPQAEYKGLSYYNASAGNADDYYYDDNEWVCIQLLLGARQLGDDRLLEAARNNLEFLWTGWDDALGGGIYWSKDCTSKNACSNAPAAIAFLLAYQLTGEESYLEKGKRIYAWMNDVMRKDNLFIDSIEIASGRKNEWTGIYNQATMIYAGSLLYEITGEKAYYDLTAATVNASIGLMFRETQAEDGTAAITMNANPIYKAWCVGWLARAYEKFYTVDPVKDQKPMEYMTAVLRRELHTKDKDGFYDPFFCSGASDPENRTELLAQDGVASAFLCTAYYDALLKTNLQPDPCAFWPKDRAVSRVTGLPYREMGDTIMQAFIGRYYDDGHLVGSCFWSDAEIIETFIDAYEQTGNKTYLDYAETTAKNSYLNAGKPFASWESNPYNDDIAWGAIALCRLYQNTGTRRYLNIAKRNFDMMFNRGWSEELGGGLLGNMEDPVNKTSCTQCPATIAACLLGKYLRNDSYYEKAVRIMDWTVAELFDHEDGRVYDLYWITDGHKDTWNFTYTQGTFIGSCMYLHEKYGDEKYLEYAELAKYYTLHTMGHNAEGIFDWERRNEFDIDGFKGILTRWLYRYAQYTADFESFEWLQRHADAAYSHRNSQNIIWTDWAWQTEEDKDYNVFGASTAVALLFNCEPWWQ